MTWLRSHGSVDVCRKSWGSRSTLKHGCEVWTVKCPSIGSRISTCWWTVVHMMSTQSGSTHCESMGPERSVEVPMMQDEVRLVLDWVRHSRSHHRDLARRRGDADRKWTEEARLGRLDGFLEGECRRLCDLGRDERYVRLNGVARRGLRGTETGRLSGAPWWRWERDQERRWGCWGGGGTSHGEGGWLGMGGAIWTGGWAGAGGCWFKLRSWVLSTNACILDSTVFFICCIISSALKDALDAGGADWGATGVGGSGTGAGGWDWCGWNVDWWNGRSCWRCWICVWAWTPNCWCNMLFCSLRAASCAWFWAWSWACDCWFIRSPPQNWPWSPIACGFQKVHILSGYRPGNMAALSDDWNQIKLVQTRCIHNSCKDRDKAQRPSVVNSTLSTAISVQMNYVHNWTSPTTTKERRTIPARMSCCLWNHVKMAAGSPLSSSKRADCCRGFQLCRSAKRKKRPGTAASCLTLTRPTCETWKKGQQFTLLKRITNSKL